MDIREILSENKFTVMDGAMGTMLQNIGLEPGERPEVLNVVNKDKIASIHKAYIESGAEIVYTNTFGANRYKLEGTGYTVDEIVGAGVEAAKSAAGNKALVALDIGPIGELLEPNGTLSFEDAYDIFSELVKAGSISGADIIVIETMTDLYELKAAILAAKENSSLPVFTTMTFEKNQRTFTGCCVESFVATAEGLGADALGINCSLGPDEIYPIVKRISEIATKPIIVKANAGLPNLETGKYDIDEELYSEYAKKIGELGVKYIGGCCGTSPEYIRKIKEKLSHIKDIDLIGIKRKNKRISCACTPTNFLEIDGIKVAGERINPTGKKRFKQALIENDMDYILSQAIEQVDGGADILDVNVGLPEINEAEIMKNTIKSIQSITDTVLQVDSSKKEALEAGVRVYNGKPIINSVNGEQKSMDSVLPIVKKYGCGVVALTLDENGIPETVDERVNIAEKIIKEAEKYEIPREDIYVDCLTLTVSAEQEAALETLKAVKRVKESLGVKTILGVSNISFGLPNRDLINSVFLTMAMNNGLDIAIINPNSEVMMNAVSAYKVLADIDKDAEKYIGKFNGYSSKKEEVSNLEENKPDIFDAISKGLKEETGKITKELLKEKSEMDIINNYLIPALDKVGERYEKGEIFLPQLIKSATASQEAFEIIKKTIAGDSEKSISKGTIVMATVKGDIHDIGKNIVKVILENYGYRVIDLGRDVDIEKVADTVKNNNIKLLGLSALMTTTLISMEKTIKRVREVVPECKIMVGGAVLTEDYAEKIGADYYCKDASKSVECAKKIFG